MKDFFETLLWKCIVFSVIGFTMFSVAFTVCSLLGVKPLENNYFVLSSLVTTILGFKIVFLEK